MNPTLSAAGNSNTVKVVVSVPSTVAIVSATPITVPADSASPAFVLIQNSIQTALQAQLPTGSGTVHVTKLNSIAVSSSRRLASYSLPVDYTVDTTLQCVITSTQSCGTSSLSALASSWFSTTTAAVTAGVADTTSQNGFANQLKVAVANAPPSSAQAAFQSAVSTVTASNTVPAFDYSTAVVSTTGGGGVLVPAAPSNNTSAYYAALFFGCFLAAVLSGAIAAKCVAFVTGSEKGADKRRGESASRVVGRDNQMVMTNGDTFL